MTWCQVRLANMVYNYVVDESNNLKLVVRGSRTTGTKHTQLTGGAPAKAAGELMISNGRVILNNESGRYRRQLPSAVTRVKAMLQSLDFPVDVVVGPL